jgi:hypothetical protein
MHVGHGGYGTGTSALVTGSATQGTGAFSDRTGGVVPPAEVVAQEVTASPTMHESRTPATPLGCLPHFDVLRIALVPTMVGIANQYD